MFSYSHISKFYANCLGGSAVVKPNAFHRKTPKETLEVKFTNNALSGYLPEAAFFAAFCSSLLIY
jgi:hypothetical protein